MKYTAYDDRMVSIDLGCGLNKREGSYGLDSCRLDPVDVVANLEQYHFPFKDNSMDTVYSSHVLEHVEDPVKFMKEAGRIVKDDGRIVVTLPLAGEPGAFQSDHKHFMRARDFYYYEKDNKCHYYVSQAGEYHIEKVEYSHRYPIYLLPLWIAGVITAGILNTNSKTVREIYENFLLPFFPLSEFTVTLVAGKTG